MLTKIIATTAILAASAGSLTAGEDLDRIMTTKSINVTVDPNWPPQSFLNENNEMDGFDVDVAREIARRIGVEIKFSTPSWDVVTSGKWHDRFDLSVGSMTPTEQRSEVLDFPGIYYFTPASIAVPTDSSVQTLEELNGKRICTATATTQEQYLQGDLVIDAVGAPPFEYVVQTDDIMSMSEFSACLDAARLGAGKRIDATLNSLPALLEAIEAGVPIRIVGDPVFYEPLAIAIDKGDPELFQLLAGIVTDMHDDGTLTALSTKWYGVDYTQD